MFKVLEVPIEKITVGDQALRYEPEDDSIVELSNDIAAHGLMQPIGVCVVEGGGFQLLWGGRRLAAHRRLGRSKIDARVYDVGERSVKAVALVENLHRVNLSLQEECDAVAFLHYEEKKSPDQISSILSKSRSWVMRRLSLPTLPEELRGPVFDGRLSIASAERIGRVEDAGARAYLATQAVQCGWAESDVRLAVQTYLSTPSLEPAVAAGQAVAGQQEPAQERLFVCAACGKPDSLQRLRNVWIHSGGCAPAPESPGKGGDNGGRSE